MITEELKKLYITHTGHEPEAIDELPSSGSNRRYFRLKGTPTLIGVSGESVEENRAFLYMACLLYTSPSPRDLSTSRMPSSA